MQNGEPGPAYAAPPQGAAPGVLPAPRSSPKTIVLSLTAVLLLAVLAVYLLWRAWLTPGTPAGRGPLPEEVPLVRQASAGGAPELAAPEYGGGAPTEHLTPASGLAREENLTPPSPGFGS